jgi:hypothetical protein
LRAYGEPIACEAPSFFSELKRRNVIRAVILCVGVVQSLVITETFSPTGSGATFKTVAVT